MTNSPYRHLGDNKLPTEDEQLLESPPPLRPEQLFLKSDSWRVLRIMGEFVWGFDNLADVSDGVKLVNGLSVVVRWLLKATLYDPPPHFSDCASPASADQ